MVPNDAIRAKIEELMGWKPGGSNSFSLRALQSFVRGKDPEFDEELARYLDMDEHFFVPVRRRKAEGIQ
jgi:hypothetical protein